MKKESLSQILQRNKRTFTLAAGLLVLVLGVVIILLLKENGELKNDIDLLNAQKEELTQVMQKDKTEMQEQITLLSNQVAEQLAREEAEAERHYPNGLPMTGKVTINSQPTVDPDVNPEELPDKELRKIVIFGAQDDAKVIAAGSGTVLSIKPDSEFGHVIRIDHGNGYITVYRYSDSPKVKEGDDVTKGQLLFEVNSSNSRVGYQVQYDKDFIDPMDVMEISG